MTTVRYAIIGGGVVGRAIAHALAGQTDDIVVIERCHQDHLENQSTRNAGVIHAGIYYKRPVRPLKARLCVEGNALLYRFCVERGVPHAACGKLVVATSTQEEEYLDDVLQTGLANQVPGLRLISGDEARLLEPNVAATKALYVPTSGVVDAASYLTALKVATTAHYLFATTVVAITPVSRGFEITTTSGHTTETFVARHVVNAAGLYADDIARMVAPNSPYTIMPVRGEAARFTKHRRPELFMTGMNVYPIPHGFYKDGQRARVGLAEFRTLLASRVITDTVGLHLTPTLDEHGRIASTVTISPCITTGMAKDDYGSRLREPLEFWSKVKEFFPGLLVEDVELHQAGIQARLADHLDWIIEPAPVENTFINLIGIDSPGMTASLAIAHHVVEMLRGANS